MAEEEGSSKLWGCVSEILQESNHSVSTERITSDEDIEATQASAPEVALYLTGPLFDLKKVRNTFKWWQDNIYVLAKVARRYLPSLGQVFILSVYFSVAGKVYDDESSGLTPKSAECHFFW